MSFLSPHFGGYISHIIQLTPQAPSAEPRKSASAETASSGQKTKRGIEGEDAALAAIETFFSFLVGGAAALHLEGALPQPPASHARDAHTTVFHTTLAHGSTPSNPDLDQSGVSE